MTFRTRRKPIIPRLAAQILKANRSRNLLIICAITLTTLLITSMFTVAFSLNRSMELAQMKTTGSDFHGSFKYLTPEEADKLSQDPLLKTFGKTVLVGQAANDAFLNNPIEIDQTDENTAKHSFVRLLAGRLPEREQDIVMSTWALDLLGVPHQLGAKVALDMNINGTKVSRLFDLAGYYEADRYVAISGLAFVSDVFVKQNLSGIDPKQSRLTGSYVNTTRLDVMFSNSFGLDNKMKKVLSDSGIHAAYGVNRAYASVGLFGDVMNVLPYAALILIVMLSGYLLIYNIFHISVVRDIKFYGLLKTIGTTPRQLRKLITAQANRLYLIAMPIGLAFGYGIGCWLAPMMNSFSAERLDTSYSFSPIIFAGAALFSYFTVRIAASRPGRMAARISPIEAVRYTGISTGGTRKKQTRRGAKLSRMALANLLRYKKKLFLMLASLSLSLILFSIVYTVIASLDINKYLNAFISGDMVVKEAGNDSRAIGITALTPDICRTLSAFDGVTSVDKVYYKPEPFKLNGLIKSVLEPLAAKEDPQMPVFTSILKGGVVDLQLHGLGAGWLNVLQPSDIAEGSFDPVKFASGNEVLITEALLDGDHNATYYHPGDRITFDGLGKSYEVMAVLQQDALYAAGTSFYTIGGFKVFLPEDEFARRITDPGILSATLHIDPSKLDQTEKMVDSFIRTHPELTMKSREDYKAEMNGFIRIFRTLGYGLSFIVALIGVLNYINTVMTGILSRQNEFATLESVGMTRKQLKTMLIYEGMYSILLVVLIAATAGLYLTYRVAKGIAGSMAFTVFHMSVWPIASAALLLIAVSVVVSLAAHRELAKLSIVDRLRKAE